MGGDEYIHNLQCWHVKVTSWMGLQFWFMTILENDRIWNWLIEQPPLTDRSTTARPHKDPCRRAHHETWVAIAVHIVRWWRFQQISCEPHDLIPNISCFLLSFYLARKVFFGKNSLPERILSIFAASFLLKKYLSCVHWTETLVVSLNTCMC